MAVRNLSLGTNTTYAINIADWNLFKSFWLNYKNRAAFTKDLVKKYENVGTEAPLKVLETIFLKAIGDFGIKINLLQANSDFTNWNVITYDSASNTPIKTPCL